MNWTACGEVIGRLHGLEQFELVLVDATLGRVDLALDRLHLLGVGDATAVQPLLLLGDACLELLDLTLVATLLGLDRRDLDPQRIALLDRGLEPFLGLLDRPLLGQVSELGVDPGPLRIDVGELEEDVEVLVCDRHHCGFLRLRPRVRVDRRP